MAGPVMARLRGGIAPGELEARAGNGSARTGLAYDSRAAARPDPHNERRVYWFHPDFNSGARVCA